MGYNLYRANNAQEGENSLSERPQEAYGSRFAMYVSRHIASAITDDYRDKANTARLIYALLKPVMCGRDGLLEQYLHSQLDLMVDRFKRTFSLGNVSVDYNHASHAKFASIVDAIEKQISADKAEDKP